MTKMDPEAFRSDHARLFETLRGEKGSCPDPDLLLAYHHAGLTASETRLLEEHLSLCAVCSELLDRLRLSEQPVDDLTWKRVEGRLDARATPWRAAPKRKNGAWIRRRYWVAAAAGLVLVVGGLVVWSTRDTVPMPFGPASPARGEMVQLHEPAGVVSGVRIFTWSALPVASEFRLQIRHQGRIVWETTTDESRYRPPAELSPLLVPGEPFEWRVEALDDDGNPVAESSWMAFERSP